MSRGRDFVVKFQIEEKQQARVYDQVIDELHVQFRLYEALKPDDRRASPVRRFLRGGADIFAQMSEVWTIGRQIAALDDMRHKERVARLSKIRIWAILCLGCHVVNMILFLTYCGTRDGGLLGRLVALSFSFVASKYYLSIYARLWLVDVDRFAHWAVRWTSVFFIFPISYLIVFNPAAWPIVSSAGALAIPVNNFATYFFARRTFRKSQGVQTQKGAERGLVSILWPPTREEEGDIVASRFLRQQTEGERALFLRDYFAWGFATAVFFPSLLIVGVLLNHEVLKDTLAYGVITLVIIWQMYVFNCSLRAGRIRAALEREMYLAIRQGIKRAVW